MSSNIEQVGFYLSAKGLPKMDLTSNTDPFAVVFFKNQNGEFDEIGRTEIFMDRQEADWLHQFVVDYKFEEVQELRVEVYDEDDHGNPDLSRHDFIGRCDFTMSQLMGARGQSLQIDLKNDKGKWRGVLFVKAEEILSSNDQLEIQFYATRKLAKKDGFFGKSDPFIRACTPREDGSYQAVWQSEVVMDNLKPEWSPTSIRVQDLCNSDLLRPLRWEVYDFDEGDSPDEFMGFFTATVHSLVQNPSEERLVIEQDRLNERGYHDSGAVACHYARVIYESNFLNFIRGGCEISMMVGIDFTGSNGAYTNHKSLHYIDPSGNIPNEYQQAILSVGSILQDYDHDCSFPVYGFGGRVGDDVSHTIPLARLGEGNENNGVNVHGVDGILRVYQSAQEHITLAGPTLFAPLIRMAAQRASNPPPSQENQKYHVLLLICDGIINDMTETIDQIVAASELPLSIIIVGVGEADFSDMDALDADDEFLTDSQGNRASRDIVQFVNFRELQADANKLEEEVLAEVPKQMTDYFHMRAFTPNAPTERLKFDPTTIERLVAEAEAEGDDEEEETKA